MNIILLHFTPQHDEKHEGVLYKVVQIWPGRFVCK
jgi:hypothetical protein